MGELMRPYWVLALLSELVPDGPQIRLTLLGELLIAFRDSSGRVGIMDHRCLHRCASLFLGRNKNDGLRCVYHGWKFDEDDNCAGPNLPGPLAMRNHVKAKAYKVNARDSSGPRGHGRPHPRFFSGAWVTGHGQIDAAF